MSELKIELIQKVIGDMTDVEEIIGSVSFSLEGTLKEPGNDPGGRLTATSHSIINVDKTLDISTTSQKIIGSIRIQMEDTVFR
jgi:hypothetical protein